MVRAELRPPRARNGPSVDESTGAGGLIPYQPGYVPGAVAPYDPRSGGGGGYRTPRTYTDPDQKADRPLKPWESVTRELKRVEADDEPPPLQDGPDDPAEGGATCKVTFSGGLVIKQCAGGDLKLEYELTQHAEQVLGDERVVDMAYREGELSIERLDAGVVYAKRGGTRKYWESYGEDDSPKLGRVRNFSAAAKARLRADVEKLHANGIAHGDIHAGNLGIREIGADGQVADVILIDYSEAVDLARLGDVPTNPRQIARGIAKGADWYTPYVMKKMNAGTATAQELFEEAKAYDLKRLEIMGL